MNEEPLIFTTKGNIPISGLQWQDGWEFSANGITYWSEYTLDSEVVRRDVARYQLPEGSQLSIEQSNIGI